MLCPSLLCLYILNSKRTNKRRRRFQARNLPEAVIYPTILSKLTNALTGSRVGVLRCCFQPSSCPPNHGTASPVNMAQQASSQPFNRGTELANVCANAGRSSRKPPTRRRCFEAVLRTANCHQTNRKQKEQKTQARCIQKASAASRWQYLVAVGAWGAARRGAGRNNGAKTNQTVKK